MARMHSMQVSTENKCFTYPSFFLCNDLKFLAIWGLIRRWFFVPLRPKAYLLSARLLKFTRILIRPQPRLLPPAQSRNHMPILQSSVGDAKVPLKTVRRGLVFEGGGGKGAFAVGCMKAFKERDVTFDAITGTSAGALCALMWSTDSVAEGERIWLSIGQKAFFGSRPDGCVRRLIKVLLSGGKLFAAFIRGIDLEGQPQFARDGVFSLVFGVLYWVLLIGLLPPAWLWGLFPVVVPAVALFASSDELPGVGWDSRTRRLLLDVLLWLATTKAVVGIGEHLLTSGLLGGLSLGLTWPHILLACSMVAALLLSLDLHSTLAEGKTLALHMRTFLAKPMQLPIYVTVAKEAAPESPHFFLPTPGVFACVYARLDKAPPELAEGFVYASAALPFGILPSVRIGEHLFVDGGVADNTPALPLVAHSVDEIWIIRLRPSRIDLKAHFRAIVYQQMLATGQPGLGEELLEKWLDSVRVVQITPQTNLGGMLTGTLNFAEHRSRALVRHGYRVTMRAIANPDVAPRIYRRRFTLRQRAMFVLKALPGCTFPQMLRRGTLDTSPPFQDLKALPVRLPHEVRPANGGHSQPVSHAARISLAIIVLSLSSTAFEEGRTTAGSLWCALVVWLLFVFPSWWPRFKRMQGL